MTGVPVDSKSLRFPRIILEPILYGLGTHKDARLRDEVLRLLDTTADAFDADAFTLDGEQLLRLYRWSKERALNELGVSAFLSRFSATSAGLAGMAALSARNVREALLVAVRYLPLLVPAMRAELVEDKRHMRFKLEMVADLGELNQPMLEIVAAAVSIISDDVMAEPVPRTLHLSHGYGNRRGAERVQELEEALGHPVRFSSSFTGLEGNIADLTIPTRSPNDATFSSVKRILEAEMANLALTQSFANVARQELMRLANSGVYPSLEGFADIVHLSPRTLIRKLAAEDTSFKQLSSEIRFRLAIELLEKTQFSIKQVASRAGFNNANSFSRAFKAQYGKTPLEWRQNV